MALVDKLVIAISDSSLTSILRGRRVRSPHYQKLRIRVIHIRDNRRGQPNRSAMGRPRPGGTAFLITVSPMPGKYEFCTVSREGHSNAENLNTAIQDRDVKVQRHLVVRLKLNPVTSPFSTVCSVRGTKSVLH